jgi:hypothetical protein
VLEQADQFPHIPRPGAPREQIQRFARKRAWSAPLFPGPGAEDVVGQRGDVRGAVAQRRHRYMDAAEPLVELSEERSFPYRRLEIAPRGSDEAHIGPDYAPGARAFAFHEEAQQPPLQRQAETGDAVQEKGAPLGQLDPSRAAFPRAGKGSGAEHSTFEDALRGCGAIDLDEAAAGAAAHAVDGPCDHLLADPLLPRDQHRGVARRRFLDEADDGGHGRGTRDQGGRGRFALEFPADAGVFQGPVGGADRPVHRRRHRPGVQGFRKVIEGPRLDGRDRRREGRLPCEDEDGEAA